ncbi:MAG: hypothetical protein GY866_18195 [Proteobacteria bacterium]|nr:hypothetical protein [Pseudomonadota bacterium]
MAKKKKQKKAGLAQRKKNKADKKRAFKKKIQAGKPVQKKISQSKIKQNLKNLPSLVFEPELDQIAFTSQQIEEIEQQHEKVPDQIEAIATPEFLETFKEQCGAMKLRFERENDVNKSMMVHAILYFMEEGNAPAYLNQIVVGMFFRTQAEMGKPDEPVTLKELNQMLKDYDAVWGSYLEEKAKELEIEEMLPSVDQQNALVSTAEEQEGEEEDELALTPSLFEPLLEEFDEYLASEPALDEETQERTREDAEVLFNDYCEEKDISRLEELRPRKIQSFLESWFVRTMHPTQEDLEIMLNSLELFFKFVEKQGKMPEDTCREILSIFENKEALLSNLNI